MNRLQRPLLLFALLAGIGIVPCRAELSEPQVKSAYVFNFIKFVEWPPAASGGNKLRLCVIGDNELRGLLAMLDGRRIGERELQVLPNASDNLSACHVLYIGENERRRVAPIIKSLGDAPTLTISDVPDFVGYGGNIGLLHRENRMLFEINLASTRKAGLRLSGQMLNLSHNIIGK